MKILLILTVKETENSTRIEWENHLCQRACDDCPEQLPLEMRSNLTF